MRPTGRIAACVAVVALATTAVVTVAAPAGADTPTLSSLCSSLNGVTLSDGFGQVSIVGTFNAGEQFTVDATGATTNTTQMHVDGALVASAASLPTTFVYVFQSTAQHHLVLTSSPGASSFHLLCSHPPAPTSVAVVPTPSEIEVGSSTTVTATVSRLTYPGTPTGTVSFFVDGASTASATVALGSTGAASYLQQFTTAVTHHVTAVYSGDDLDQGTSSTADVVVDRADTTTTLNATPTTQAPGQPVMLSGTVGVVSPGAATPTGSVTILNGSNPIAAAALVNGSYSTSVSTLVPGAYTLHAVYTGDSNFAVSSSPNVTVTITRYPTAIVADPALLQVRGSLVSVTVAVLSARLFNTTLHAPISGQRLVFRSGTTTLCTAITDATGRGTCTTSAVGALLVTLHGGYTVSYAGSSAYLPSVASAGLVKL